MRQVAAGFGMAGVAILVAGCGGSSQPNPTSTTTITSLIPRPVVERELDSLLLTPAQINPLMGATAMALVRRHDKMSDDSSAMKPPECLAIDGAVQAPVYANSGYTGMRDQELNDGDNFTHYAEQAVVLFPTVKQAHVFLVASALRWPACHQYTHTQSRTVWDVAPISYDNDTVSTVSTQEQAKAGGWACGHALSAKNNVVVDVNTCSPNPGNSAVDIASQIVAKIGSR
ncbi:sensor domain-containing protein [Mycobacterium paraterrae]|uniref:Sensor domain-containing protein n=1 Tax=Mycobacterium paraterrae TaxID=577492 RepID=A0ABY3VRV9_9MYCO|nr:sensor domain-containing protein [Mycobacterium paraterrae]UMB72223.1 sensor domain-containing protein [Mycobacterium paraterrae]